MNRDAVAISVLFRRGDDRSQRNIFKLADPLEHIAHLAPFYRQLMFVADVLVCASAALSKIRALRCDAMWRAFLNSRPTPFPPKAMSSIFSSTTRICFQTQYRNPKSETNSNLQSGKSRALINSSFDR